MSCNEYVCLINCDRAVAVLTLKRLISVMYQRDGSELRNPVRSRSVNFMEYHINAESRKQEEIICLTSC